MLDRHPGAPLATFETGMTADVGLHCHQCARYQVIPLAKVIASLDARGLQGRRIGIRELASHIRRPCPRCGSVSQETRPVFHPQPGAGRA